MPLDELDPSSDMLDLSSLLGASPQAPAVSPTQPQMPQAKPQSKWAQAALAALMPIAAKRGGRVAVSALMQGFQQAQARQQAESQQQGQQQFQNERLMQADQRANEAQAATEQYRQQQLIAQRQQQAAALVKDYAARYAGAETQGEIDALNQSFPLAARMLGVRPDVVTAIASKASPTPSALIEKQVKKAVGSLKPEQVDQYLQGNVSLAVPGQEMPVPAEVWSKYITGAVDPITGKRSVTVQKPDVPSNPAEADVADALAIAEQKKGGPLTAEERLAVRRKAVADFSKLNDQPRQADPILEQIRQIQLQQLQNNLATGAMSPAQFQQAQSLSNDYRQDTKNFWVQRSAYQQLVSASPAQDSPAGHMALVFAYMKLLDPNSVVRETEYATAQNAAGVPDRIRNLYNSIVDGAILTPRQIVDFKNQARQIYVGAKRGAVQQKAVYDARATAQGLKPEAVTYMLDDPTAATEAVPPSGRAAVTPPTSAPAKPPVAGAAVPNPFRPR